MSVSRIVWERAWSQDRQEARAVMKQDGPLVLEINDGCDAMGGERWKCVVWSDAIRNEVMIDLVACNDKLRSELETLQEQKQCPPTSKTQ